MPIPRVAIVGLPNAGKSSLMNLLAGAKVSIVDPTPGVTRDRVSAIVDLPPPYKNRDGSTGAFKPIELIDTGGFGVYVAQGARYDEVGNDLAKLTESIEFQIGAAVESADLILFAVDAQSGVTPGDKEIARLLREGAFARRRDRSKGGPAQDAARPRAQVRVVATKVDGPRFEPHAAELSALGFGEPMMVSAKNNYLRREFVDTLYDLVSETPPEDQHRARADLMVAIIGKRNAGKSTLINTLAGETRVIASEIPGTTRDAVDVRFEVDGRSIVAIDTAGLRKKKSFQNMIDHYALDRVERSVDRCDVVLLLLDATEQISQVDEQLAHLAQQSFKPAIIVVNKWDLAQGQRDDRGRPATPQRYEEYVRRELRGLWYAPIAFMSGASGLNVRRTLDLAMELKQQAARRVTTGVLNRMVRDIVARQGPSDLKGRFAKVYYVAQTGVEPPTITMVVNHPDMFRPNYLRFLSNRFREELPFPEVPLRIIVRARRQREDELLAADEAGEGGTIRVSRGRKGVKERLGGFRADDASLALPEGDAWLSDEHSAAVDIDETGAVRESAVDADAAKGSRDRTRPSDHEGFGDIDEADLGALSRNSDQTREVPEAAVLPSPVDAGKPASTGSTRTRATGTQSKAQRSRGPAIKATTKAKAKPKATTNDRKKKAAAKPAPKARATSKASRSTKPRTTSTKSAGASKGSTKASTKAKPRGSSPPSGRSSSRAR